MATSNLEVEVSLNTEKAREVLAQFSKLFTEMADAIDRCVLALELTEEG